MTSQDKGNATQSSGATKYLKRTGPYRWLISIAAIVIIVIAVTGFYKTSEPTDRVEIGDATVEIEVADTVDARSRGLSGRDNLRENEGMWFVFDRSGKYNFHMKDMNFPLDIIWLDERLEVVDITAGVKPDTYPQTFTSEQPARYVLEVNAGFASEHGINIGTKAHLRPAND